MDALPSFDEILQTARLWTDFALQNGGDWAARLLAVDLPVPDAALLFAFCLLLYAVRTTANGAADRSRDEIEAVYQSELLTANRRAQQARGELQSAKKEIERERQKRRREARGEFRGVRRKPAQVVELSHPTVHQAPRVNA